MLPFRQECETSLGSCCPANIQRRQSRTIATKAEERSQKYRNHSVACVSDDNTLPMWGHQPGFQTGQGAGVEGGGRPGWRGRGREAPATWWAWELGRGRSRRRIMLVCILLCRSWCPTRRGEGICWPGRTWPGLFFKACQDCENPLSGFKFCFWKSLFWIVHWTIFKICLCGNLE